MRITSENIFICILDIVPNTKETVPVISKITFSN